MEEMLDTFDINKNFLGTRARSFCHGKNPGVYYKAVWIWIINDNGEILVQKRALTKKKNPGLWDMSAAGHVAAGETVIQACVREANEELGINAKADDFIFLNEFLNKRGWNFVYTYLLKLNNSAEDFKLQTEEVEQVKWLKYNNFVNLFYSADFCLHEDDYKNFIRDTLKRYTTK